MRNMNAAAAAAMLVGAISAPAGSRWSGRNDAKQTSEARALRNERRITHRGTASEQANRVAAAHEKRARKAMRQHRNALKDGTEFRA